MATKKTENNHIQFQKRLFDVQMEPARVLSPIEGYADMPLVSLEEAVEPLTLILRDIKSMAALAKMNCNQPPHDNLTVDQSASIILYSMPWTSNEKCLSVVLNATLHDEHRGRLRPWFLYLKLFFTALAHLPSTTHLVYHFSKGDLRQDYRIGNIVTWWGFTSCTSSMDVLRNIHAVESLGCYTLFTIECDHGKHIGRHSVVQNEDEILLPPARQFQVVSLLAKSRETYLVHLKEIHPHKRLVDLLLPASALNSYQIVKIPTSATVTKQSHAHIPLNASWMQHGEIVAGGNNYGDGLHQLFFPKGIVIDDKGTLYIADYNNHRVMAWKSGSKTGRIVAGDHASHQLRSPLDVLLDVETDSLIICDFGNKRIVRRPLQHDDQATTIIERIACRGLTMDDQGFLYVSDDDMHQVRRFDRGDTQGIVVAGDRTWGNSLNQLNAPYFLFIDDKKNLYVSDWRNHRVVKWPPAASRAVHVAGEIVDDGEMTKRTYFEGIWVDQFDRVYVVEDENDRVTQWTPGETRENVIVGGNGRGTATNQFAGASGLYFDRQGNLYVADSGNHRVLRFAIKTS